MTSIGPSYFSLLVLSAVLSALPFLMVTVTSFAKISIVLFLIRNALGIQQTPPGILLNTIAIVLTLYIMAPVLRDIYTIAIDPRETYATIQDWERVGRKAIVPVRNFLEMHVRPEAKQFFLESTTKVWAGRAPFEVSDKDFLILMPSFMVSELTRAFEIGFLLYLPFLVVDFVISIILVAMGMQMLSPTVISTPFKLLLFVFVDGWSRLLQGLVLSYVPS